jgi:adenine-specific DNA-methyltransferase
LSASVLSRPYRHTADACELLSADPGRQIKEARRSAAAAVSFEEKLEAQRRMKAIESTRSRKRRTLFESQDEIDRKRDSLIAALEAQLTQNVKREHLFTMPWRIV